MNENLRSQIVMDLTGTYGQVMREWDGLTAKFATGAHYSLGVAGRAWQTLGKGIDSIGGNFYARIAAGGGLALAVHQVADFDEQLDRIGLRANVSADRVGQLKQQIFDMANRADVRVSIHDIADGVDAIMRSGGDLQFAEANMRNLGLTIRATGESGESIGELIGFLHTLGVDTPDEAMKIIDSWNRMGKASGTSLTDMISDSKQLLDTYKDMGRTGPQAALEIGAAFSMVKQSVGDPNKAARDLQIFLNNIRDKWYELQSAGVQVYDPKALAQGRYEMNSLAEIIPQILKVTHGDGLLFHSLFGDRGDLALSASLEQFRKNLPIDAMQKYLNLQGDGSTTSKDAARSAMEFNAALQSLGTSWDKFADSNLAKPIKELADELNSLKPETVQNWMSVGKYITEGVLGLYALRQGVGLVKDIDNAGRYIFTGKSGQGAAAATAAYGGATPVFVVNMGGGGGLAGGAGALPEVTSNAGKLATAFSVATRAVGAFSAGYAAGSALYYGAMQDNKTGDITGRIVAMLFGGKDSWDAIRRRDDADAIVARGRAGIYKDLPNSKAAKIDMRVSFDATSGKPYISMVSSSTHDIDLAHEIAGGVLAMNPS